MRSLQVTLLATATPVVTKGVQPANSLPFQVLVFQNNSNHLCTVGDSTVSATKGVLLSPTGGASSSAVSMLTVSPALEYTSDLYEWYIFGTAGDVIDVLLLD